jgi:hypothetical protein
MLSTTGGNLPQSKGLPDAIALSVLSAINMTSIFQELD